MTLTSLSKGLLKIAAVAVTLAAVLVLVVVFAPALRGQTVHERPFVEELREGLRQGLRSQLIRGSEVGITIRDVDAADVTREKLPEAAGAVVEDVRSGSAAARAGVRAGDVFVAFDGERIRSARQLSRLIDETPTGREVAAAVFRNGQKVELKLTAEASPAWTTLSGLRGLRELPWVDWTDHYSVRVPDRLPPLEIERDRALRDLLVSPSRGRLGVEVQELTGQLGDYFGTPAGLLVTSVDEGTPAKTAGLKAGDVITKVNERDVRTAADLRRELGRAAGETRLTLVRDRKTQTLTVKLEDDAPVERPRIIR